MGRIGSFRTRLALIAAAGLALRVLYVLVLARDVGGAGDYARARIAVESRALRW